jgi:hypothetical protein
MGATYPNEFFRHNPPAFEPQTCFVIMRFTPPYEDVFNAIVAAVKGPSVHFASCKRAKELKGGGHIMDEVLDRIARSELIVADVTERNPNVFYEIGIAHAIKPFKTVILITQTMEDMPFDIKDFRIIEYTNTPPGLAVLRDQLVDFIQKATPARFRFAVKHSETYTYRERLPGPDNELYYFQLGPLTTGIGFARFHVVVRRYVDGLSDAIVSEFDSGLSGGKHVEIPILTWTLNLDRVVDDRAHFCLSEPVSAAV